MLWTSRNDFIYDHSIDKTGQHFALIFPESSFWLTIGQLLVNRSWTCDRMPFFSLMNICNAACLQKMDFHGLPGAVWIFPWVCLSNVFYTAALLMDSFLQWSSTIAAVGLSPQFGKNEQKLILSYPQGDFFCELYIQNAINFTLFCANFLNVRISQPEWWKLETITLT